MPEAATIEAAFRTFVAKADDAMKAHLKANYTHDFKDRLEVDEGGRRYWRVVRADDVSRSAYCFVDKATGDVLKPDGWKRPAKHARGNVLNPDNGLGAVTAYGTVYLR